MPRFMIGIDLGTTNSALAFIDTKVKAKAGVKIQSFAVPQLVAAGQVSPQPLLPSFLYLPGPHDLPPGSIALPWKANAADAVGQFARSQGAKVPGRLVSSAKSWLCHSGVDRLAPVLPWGSPPEVERISPVEASAKYLKHLVEAWNHLHPNPHDRIEEQSVVLTVPASFDDVARTLTAEAAKSAGLKHVSLIEEPQAAFYAWLGTHSPTEAGMLKPGMRCLVVDVGGGTSDFSLIHAEEADGELNFVRDAVGEHLLLGGDNMDLALAKTVEAKLPGGRLDATQFGALVQACRQAKETLLGEDPPAGVPVTVMGRGRSVVGGSLSVTITVEDVRSAIFEGFFPAVSLDTEPARAARSGLQEMGLPYVADAAITKHLAAFLRSQSPGSQRLNPVDAVLFNGGVFTPKSLQQRLLDVARPWFEKPGEVWNPLVLTSPSLDLAVAWGAAYSAWLKHSGGKRIGGGIPRSYYIGVSNSTGDADAEATGSPAAATLPVVCVVPRRIQEGEEISIPEPELELQIGRPVLFPLYTSTARGDDSPGDVLSLLPSQLHRLPPLHTMLRGGKRAGAKRVPVTLAARCTEIGTLELYCVSREGNRWRLEFNVREGSRIAQETDAPAEPTRILDVFPEEKVQAALDLIHDCFTGSSPTPPELPKRLEEALETSRLDWPTGLCRRLVDVLLELADRRTRSPQHLARWYNLVGFCLRPGFGDPLDRYRVEGLWKTITATTAAGGKVPTVLEGGADFWIMWRRVAGGLNTALQQVLFGKLKPTLLPGRGKAVSKPPAHEWAEMWRAAAALERLDPRTRQHLGEALLRQVEQRPVQGHVFWALTRLGTRQPFYGPLNTILHPDIATKWLEELIDFTPTNDAEKLGWAFALAQLAKRTGLRGVDLDDEHRESVATLLRTLSVPDAWPKMVEEIVDAAGDDQNRLFGENLPIGLRLAGS